MNRVSSASLLAGFAALLMLHAGPAQADRSAAGDLDLEKIMADPEWIGRQPQDAYWADDGRGVYYWQEREGSDLRDLVELRLDGSEPRIVGDDAMGGADQDNGDWDRDHQRKVYTHASDVFLKELATGERRQITRTTASESFPMFMADQRRLAWKVGEDWYIYDPETSLVSQVAEIRAEDDPHEDREPEGYLEEQQLRLFSTLRKEKAEREAEEDRERTRRAEDPSRLPPPFYLGDGVRVVHTSLSPAGRYMLVVTQAEDRPGWPNDKMPVYVNEKGMVEARDVRPLVGTGPLTDQALLLIDLKEHETVELDMGELPEIHEDPLYELKKEKAEREDAEEEPERRLEEPRPVQVAGLVWTEDGSRVAVQIFSSDNKDRWIASVDFEDRELVTHEHLHDPAWVNYYHNDLNWLPDNRTLWFQSERSGHSQLYIKAVDERSFRRLTSDGYRVMDGVTSDPDGRWLYFAANHGDPGIYEIYRAATDGSTVERVTTLGGGNEFRLSPQGDELLITHGAWDQPPELFVQDAQPDSLPDRITETTSEAFRSVAWTEPRFVEVPSSHVDEPIRARLYLPEDHDPSKTYPAVMFVHGAGYLQNADQGWSGYFREFMFNSLLTRHGYVVLDMDYRGSAGYGRDWRTAIYRNMGHPEVEDLRDGVEWLAETQGVDEGRVGVYGGSYGGFLVFMSMFRDPQLFAAGASLRPVTDWAHYNHGYTSNILNTPELDPEAYARSSPIEFAEGLENPLLICHGVLDDNVFFKDTVRLVQRLIELKKEDFETAIYPLDPHGFEHPEAWLDEYRRIFKLMERHLQTPDA